MIELAQGSWIRNIWSAKGSKSRHGAQKHIATSRTGRISSASEGGQREEARFRIRSGGRKDNMIWLLL